MFDDTLKHTAQILLAQLRADAKMLTAAESCTGGLIMALLTSVPGSSDVVERGFVTYSNEAKQECLGVNPDLIVRLGAVSAEVAREMAEGALVHSNADIAVSVTGVAGPGGGTADKPIGLVHIAVAQTRATTLHKEFRFGDISRDEIRHQTVVAALTLLKTALTSATLN